jgi:hypothetical protein
MNIAQLTGIAEIFQQLDAVKNTEQENDEYIRQDKQPRDSTHGSIAQATENSASDSVEISAAGIRKAEDAENEPGKATDETRGHAKQIEDITRQGKAEAESAKIRQKCLQIAMRIINGDEVPKEDHEYLLKHDPKLYAEALKRRMPNENPLKHDRLSEDEKPDNSLKTGDEASVDYVSSDNIEIVDNAVNSSDEAVQ